jgi:hypothetical protein
MEHVHSAKAWDCMQAITILCIDTPFCYKQLTSGHITMSAFFAAASLPDCVTVGRGGCQGMLQGLCSGPLFLAVTYVCKCSVNIKKIAFVITL